MYSLIAISISAAVHHFPFMMFVRVLTKRQVSVLVILKHSYLPV